jgi:hypothetical protein
MYFTLKIQSHCLKIKKPASEIGKRANPLIHLATPLPYPFKTDLGRKLCVPFFQKVGPLAFFLFHNIKVSIYPKKSRKNILFLLFGKNFDILK